MGMPTKPWKVQEGRVSHCRLWLSHSTLGAQFTAEFIHAFTHLRQITLPVVFKRRSVFLFFM